MPRTRHLLLLPLLGALAACHAVVLKPAGTVAAQQRDLVLSSTYLMLVVILPVMALTIFFAWRYRASNREARYDPEWDHSIFLELIIWAVPLLIVICLGALTWVGTHLLDPYRPLPAHAGLAPGGASAASTPLEVDVVALDWKWLFIYPEFGVASVNELAAPIDRQITFRITASTVMNSFYIPALAGQIYAMPGMETQLHAVMAEPGTFQGFSANYSGAGFSGMHFAFHALAPAAFEQWIAHARAGGVALDRNGYRQLELPTENNPVRAYAAVDSHLFEVIVNRCVAPGQNCMKGMN